MDGSGSGDWNRRIKRGGGGKHEFKSRIDNLNKQQPPKNLQARYLKEVLGLMMVTLDE